MRNINPKYHVITNWAYVEDDTGKIIEEFKMREFHGWCQVNKRHVMVRSYRLDREDVLNPNREGLK